jgi:hypothetical protein
MNWKDEKTISVYDLGIIDISDPENKKPTHNHQKPFMNLNSSSENKHFIELRTKPSKSLIFSPSLNCISLKLFNDNSYPILFKLKTTEPEIISSQPARGFIQSNSFVECHLTPINIKYRIILVVQYSQILNEYDDYLTQWKNLKSENIHIKKCQCIFEDNKQINKEQSLFKPILFTFATITLLTTFIYLKTK